MRRTAALICILGLIAPGAASAAEDKYKITNAEKAACTLDAMRLCSGTYPNEDLLIACMRENRASLSRTCLVAFDAGVKRRRL